MQNNLKVKKTKNEHWGFTSEPRQFCRHTLLLSGVIGILFPDVPLENLDAVLFCPKNIPQAFEVLLLFQ